MCLCVCVCLFDTYETVKDILYRDDDITFCISMHVSASVCLWVYECVRPSDCVCFCVRYVIKHIYTSTHTYTHMATNMREYVFLCPSYYMYVTVCDSICVFHHIL